MTNRQMRRMAQRQQSKARGKGQGGAPQPMEMLQKMQEELESVTVEGSAGGGVVKVTMTGKQTLDSVNIEPEALEDLEMLQDLIVAAVNDAIGRSQEMASAKLSDLTGGLNIPGLE